MKVADISAWVSRFFPSSEPLPPVRLRPAEPGEQRNEKRVVHAARVVSKELPGMQAITVDISSTGLCLATMGPIDPGTTLQLQLQLSENDIFPIRFLGLCRWCKASDDGGPAHVGIDLKASSPRALKVLREFID